MTHQRLWAACQTAEPAAANRECEALCREKLAAVGREFIPETLVVSEKLKVVFPDV